MGLARWVNLLLDILRGPAITPLDLSRNSFSDHIFVAGWSFPFGWAKFYILLLFISKLPVIKPPESDKHKTYLPLDHCWWVSWHYRYNWFPYPNPLQKHKQYTSCLEILATDYQFWHKSIITVDSTTSQGITVKRWHVSSTHMSIKHPPIRQNLCITISLWWYSVKQLHERLISFTWEILWRRRGLTWEFIQLILINIT